MFVKNKVIDKNKIKSVIESRDLITYDSLKKDHDIVSKMCKAIGAKPVKYKEFNFYDMYELTFGNILIGLTLDELEYINDNNLFKFDNNNILDYRCKMILNKRINKYKEEIADLTNSIQKESIGSYFQRFGDLSDMSTAGIAIAIILGLNKDGVELTQDGEKLKTCISNINQLYVASKHTTMPNNIKKR